MQLSCDSFHPAILKLIRKNDITYTSYCNGCRDLALQEIFVVKICFLTDKAYNKKLSEMEESSVV